LSSNSYTDDFNEVKALGIANGTTAAPDQMLTGHFWNGAIQNYWNEIAQTAAIHYKLTAAQSARLFALLNLTLADSVIAFYYAKYTSNFLRPVTAIRAAGTDNNPDTSADPNWLPEVGTQHRTRPIRVRTRSSVLARRVYWIPSSNRRSFALTLPPKSCPEWNAPSRISPRLQKTRP
jgi:hypothetical protein